MTAKTSDVKYTFGPFRLDVAARGLSRFGQTITLAPKTFDLLLLLVENEGRVLTKAQLMATLWPDTHVEEANLSFQVSTLRKALGEEGAAWIETAPKVGYRFNATVERLPGAPPEPASSPVRRRRALLWVLGANGAVVLAIAFWLARERAIPPQPETIPLTSYQGIEREPSFSPDGSQVAFSWNGERQDNFDIYVKAVGSGPPVQLTTHPATDCVPAWSPDGRYIAFRREGDGIYLISPTGGGEQRLLSQRDAELRTLSPVTVSVSSAASGRCTQLSWSPDGKHVSFSRPALGSEPAGIFQIGLETGIMQRLTSADQASTPGAAHLAGAVSPDGRWLAFCSGSPFGSGCKIMLLALDGGMIPRGPARLIASPDQGVAAMAWTPDVAFLVYGTQAPGNFRLWKIAVREGAEPQLLSAGVAFYTPAISRAGHRMAHSRALMDADIWKVEDNGTLTRSPLSSTLNDGHPEFSPDGRKIALASARSGKNEIWVGNVDGTNMVPLTSSRYWSGSQRWSPDGRWIAYDSQTETGLWDVNVVEAAGGPPVTKIRHPAADAVPSFSRDGKWIYFYSSRNGRNEIYRTPFAGGEAVRLTDDGGWTGLESFDSKSIYYAKVSASCGVPLFVRSLAGGPERQVIDSVCARGFQVTERGIYYVDRSKSDNTLIVRLFDPDTGKTRDIRKTRTLIYADNPRLAVSPDGETILVTGSSQPPGSDLYLVENFR